MRVLLVCDREYWILCDIARNLAQILSPTMQVSILIEADVREQIEAVFAHQQSRHDVVHLLGLGTLYHAHQRIYIPCVATLWHMEDWKRFDATVDRVDFLFVGSQQWMAHAGSHVPPGITMQRMPYGVDPLRFRPDPSARAHFLQRTGLPEHTLVLGYSGNVEPPNDYRKGLDQLWACLQHLQCTTEIPIVVRLIGRGWSTVTIPADVRDLIVCEAFIERDALPQFYASLDYYVCTSRMEGVPYPVLEAMSTGCVVLSTEVGVVPELIREAENGFLLRDATLTDDFVAAIKRTAYDAKLRHACSERARTTITKDWAWTTAVSSEVFAHAYRTAIHQYRTRSRGQRLRYLYTGTLGIYVKRLKRRIRAMLPQRGTNS